MGWHIFLRGGEVEPKGTGHRPKVVSMDAVFRASWVPVNVTDVEVPTHYVEVRENQLLFKQVNDRCMIGIRVDVSQKSSVLHY